MSLQGEETGTKPWMEGRRVRTQGGDAPRMPRPAAPVRQPVSRRRPRRPRLPPRPRGTGKGERRHACARFGDPEAATRREGSVPSPGGSPQGAGGRGASQPPARQGSASDRRARPAGCSSGAGAPGEGHPQEAQRPLSSSVSGTFWKVREDRDASGPWQQGVALTEAGNEQRGRAGQRRARRGGTQAAGVPGGRPAREALQLFTRNRARLCQNRAPSCPSRPLSAAAGPQVLRSPPRGTGRPLGPERREGGRS